MKKTISKILALLLCCVLIAGITACGGGGNNNNNANNNAGGNTGGNANTSDAGGNTSGGGSTSSGGSGESTGGGGGGSAPTGSVNIAIMNDRGTLDHTYTWGWDFTWTLHTIYEPFWYYTSDAQMRYLLATGYEMIPVTDEHRAIREEIRGKDANGDPIVYTADPSVWRIHLREGVTFADGSKFDAKDAEFSLHRANNRVGEPAFISEYLKTIIIDDYTVDVVMSTSNLGHLVAFNGIVMFDSETFNDDAISTTPNGTGPYEMSEYVINSHFHVTARDGYWGEAPAIKDINFKMLMEEAQRVNALAAGEIDMTNVPFQEINYVRDLPGVSVELFPVTETRTLYMNPTSTRQGFSVLDKNGPDARRAIAYAIDRQALVNIVYDGNANVARHPVSAGIADADPSLFDIGIYGEGFNPEKAKQLAESSGLIAHTQANPLVLVNNGTPDFKLCCELIQANLNDIGVKVEIVTFDAGSWLTVVFDETQWDMAVDFTQGDTWAQSYRSWTYYHVGGAYLREPWPGVSADDSKWFLEQMDKNLMLDIKEITQYYARMTQIHTDSMIWFGLLDYTYPRAYNDKLGGWDVMYNRASGGNPLYRYLTLK